jgi:hypothetical protein
VTDGFSFRSESSSSSRARPCWNGENKRQSVNWLIFKGRKKQKKAESNVGEG